MERHAWHRKNLEEINRRLQWLRDKPEGVLYEKKTAFNRAVVVKKGSQIHLYFTGFRAGTGEPRMSGVMSRIDLDDPLDLPAVYTQAMMLTLLWREDPERICMLGYGGGRIAMVFHHFLPEVVIDCVEIDPDIVDLSEVFFGVKPGGRLRVFVQDAREFVETLPGGTRYDVVLVDCYTGCGHHPRKLAAVDFYASCRRHLKRGGVLATNLLPGDDLLDEKIADFRKSFDNTYRFEHGEAVVLFGSDVERFGESGPAVIAGEIEKRLRFPFRFAGWAGNLSVL